MSASPYPPRGAAPIAIEAIGLEKSFVDPKRGVVKAVRGIDLDCRRGEIFGLLGPNGAGKTTTLRMLATILAPSAGTARIDGVDVARDPLEARRRLGFLSGSTGLYPRLSPRETLAYFGKLHGLTGDALDARIEELVDAFSMRDYADGRCEALSTGQKQKVSIARAVLHDPPALILDEPTTGLDILASSAMIDFVESRRSAGRCVLFSTHVLSEAERLCDRIGVIFHGRVLDVGTKDELRERTGKTWLEDVFKELVRRAGEDPDAAAARGRSV
ncbi:MAG: ATP-binding cassette domain-containing protein [Planctomycetes bacterium]|nr:ATP-binding cassette domain-containing protein [Planctomycetota bacterium]